MKIRPVNHSCNNVRRCCRLPKYSPDKTGGETRFLVCLLFALVAGNASGQGNEGMAVDVGETKIYPDVGVQYVHTNNVFLDPNNEVGSSGVRVSPSLSWVADKGSLAVTADYSGNFAKYDENSLDYDDHSLALGVNAGFSKRFRADASIGISRTHEELGTNLTEGISSQVNDQVVFNNLSLSSSATYGAEGARGNLRFGLGYLGHTATNLQQLAASSEYDLLRPFVEFSLRVSPDTRATFGLEYSQIDYEVDVRDRDAYTILTGLSFAPTGKLSGSFRVGFSEVDFKSEANANTNEVVLRVSLKYVPVRYSQFSLSANREFDLDRGIDSVVTGQETVSDRLALAWRHEWSSRIYHQASIGYSASTRDCPASSTDTTTLGIGLNYYFRRWLVVGASISADSREGDLCDVATEDQDRLDYDRQIIGVEIKATL